MGCVKSSDFAKLGSMPPATAQSFCEGIELPKASMYWCCIHLGLKRFLYPYFGACVCTICILEPFGQIPDMSEMETTSELGCWASFLPNT